LAQRASVLLLACPSADAVGMVGVIAGTPGNHTSLSVRYLVGLAF
jgi:hypothetical protein